MYNLLKKLCSIHAPSGNESAMHDFLLSYIEQNKSSWKTQPQIFYGDDFQMKMLTEDDEDEKIEVSLGAYRAGHLSYDKVSELCTIACADYGLDAVCRAYFYDSPVEMVRDSKHYILYFAALYCSALYCSILNCCALYCAALLCTVLNCIFTTD